MNLRITTKDHTADPEIGFLKIDFKAVWPRIGHADSVGVKNSEINHTDLNERFGMDVLVGATGVSKFSFSIFCVG